MEFWLLDTGPIIAFLDPQDEAHERIGNELEEFTGRLVTSSAVVVEAMHFLSGTRSGPALLVDFLVSSQAEIHECTSVEDLMQAAEWMAKYADTPMDFADATLVLLAKRLKINAVCTLDRRGFRTYRIGRKAFRLVLDE
jgi:predicted nucleic acid-binding protein